MHYPTDPLTNTSAMCSITITTSLPPGFQPATPTYPNDYIHGVMVYWYNVSSRHVMASWDETASSHDMSLWKGKP